MIPSCPACPSTVRRLTVRAGRAPVLQRIFEGPSKGRLEVPSTGICTARNRNVGRPARNARPDARATLSTETPTGLEVGPIHVARGAKVKSALHEPGVLEVMAGTVARPGAARQEPDIACKLKGLFDTPGAPG